MTGREYLRSQMEALLAAQSAAAAEKLMADAPVDDELKRIEQVERLLNEVSINPRNNADGT